MIVKNGYVMLEVLNPDNLYNWVSSIFQKYNMDKSQLVDSSEYHVTLQYSKGKSLDNYKVSDYVYNIVADDSCKLELFDSKVDPTFKYALVLFLSDWRLLARNKYGKDLGATSDYPDYKPHITLAYLKEDPSPQLLKEKPNKFIINLGNETVKDLDTDYKPKTK